MTKSLLLASLVAAVALAACGKKEDMPAAAASAAAAPAVAEAASAAASAVTTAVDVAASGAMAAASAGGERGSRPGRTVPRAALDPAPAALHRGYPGAGPGGKRYWPPFNLRSHPFHHPGARLCK